MDPVSVVGLAASIAQTITTTVQLVSYINDIKDASKDRARLAMEAASLLPSLISLRYRTEQSKLTDPWFVGLRTLGVENGPLDQFKEAMGLLVRKLKPQSGIKQVTAKLLWTLDKKEINDVLSRIERMKTLVGLALQRDHLWVYIYYRRQHVIT